MFASFLQGIDGFGTPIAVVAPLLVAFGMRPVYAVAIPIIAHIWAKFYGTLGVGWLATLQVVDIDAATTASTALQAALLISIQAVLGGFTIVWLYGRWAAIRSGGRWCWSSPPSRAWGRWRPFMSIRCWRRSCRPRRPWWR